MNMQAARGKGLSWNDIPTFLSIQGLHSSKPNEKGLLFMTVATMDDIDLETIFRLAAMCNPSLIYKK